MLPEENLTFKASWVDCFDWLTYFCFGLGVYLNAYTVTIFPIPFYSKNELIPSLALCHLILFT